MAIFYSLRISHKLIKPYYKRCKYVILFHTIHTSIFIYQGISFSRGLRTYGTNSFFIAPNN